MSVSPPSDETPRVLRGVSSLGAARRSSCQTYPGERAKRPVTCPGRRRYGVDGPVREVVMGRAKEQASRPNDPPRRISKRNGRPRKTRRPGRRSLRFSAADDRLAFRGRPGSPTAEADRQAITAPRGLSADGVVGVPMGTGIRDRQKRSLPPGMSPCRREVAAVTPARHCPIGDLVPIGHADLHRRAGAFHP